MEILAKLNLEVYIANRPVFVTSLNEQYCIRENVEFEFFSGFSDKQQKKSIQSLHQAFLKKHAEKSLGNFK